MPKDYYKTMGLPATADRQTIKAAYRRLAREMHPDLNPEDAQAEEKFKQLAEAYEVLGNARKRAAYDRALWNTGWTPPPAQRPANPPPRREPPPIRKTAWAPIYTTVTETPEVAPPPRRVKWTPITQVYRASLIAALLLAVLGIVPLLWRIVATLSAVGGPNGGGLMTVNFSEYVALGAIVLIPVVAAVWEYSNWGEYKMLETGFVVSGRVDAVKLVGGVGGDAMGLLSYISSYGRDAGNSSDAAENGATHEVIVYEVCVDGSTYRNSWYRSRAGYDSMDIGDPIAIVYSAGNPGENRPLSNFIAVRVA